MSVLRVDVVSAEGGVWAGEATFVVVPAVAGDVGIAPRHAPFLAPLRPGEMRVVRPDGSEVLIYLSGGLLEVQPAVVTVLADTALRAENIDEARIAEAKWRAQAVMDGVSDEFSYARAKAELAQAAAQLKTLEDLRKRAKRRP